MRAGHRLEKVVLNREPIAAARTRAVALSFAPQVTRPVDIGTAYPSESFLAMERESLGKHMKRLQERRARARVAPILFFLAASLVMGLGALAWNIGQVRDAQNAPRLVLAERTADPEPSKPAKPKPLPTETRIIYPRG
jgi:hypothetical protein